MSATDVLSEPERMRGVAFGFQAGLGFGVRPGTPGY